MPRCCQHASSTFVRVLVQHSSENAPEFHQHQSPIIARVGLQDLVGPAVLVGTGKKDIFFQIVLTVICAIVRSCHWMSSSTRSQRDQCLQTCHPNGNLLCCPSKHSFAGVVRFGRCVDLHCPNPPEFVALLLSSSLLQRQELHQSMPADFCSRSLDCS